MAGGRDRHGRRECNSFLAAFGKDAMALMTPLGNLEKEYAALRDDCGIADLSDQTLIEVTGKDRVTFLHNMCTADVKAITPGGGTELFLTDVKGKVVAYATALFEEDAIVLVSAPNQASRIIEHLDRYIIREDVELVDRSQNWGILLVAGAESQSMLQKQLATQVANGRLEHKYIEWQGDPINVCRMDFYGPIGYWLRVHRATAEKFAAALSDEMVACGSAAVEMLRIESGTPTYGIDITNENLPQEVDRNNRAISFTKGCYLGQETVARIDALGHVNKILRGIQFQAERIPKVGTSLRVGDKEIGRVTSAGFSQALQKPLALAYLRRGFETPTTQVESDAGEGQVVLLPIVG